MLERIESTINGIKTVLLNDEQIRKLLFNDSNNALELPSPTKQEVENYITNYPVFEFENKKDYAQNSMINIFLTNATPDDEYNACDGIIQISVVTNVDKWSLTDGGIRPIKLANRIIKLLDNKKFSISNPIKFDTMDNLILSKQLVGYALLFSLTDGNSNLENF